MSHEENVSVVNQIDHVVDEVLARSTGHRLERPEIKFSPLEQRIADQLISVAKRFGL
jgi:hypothetical protein